jgi:KUP system potassium uptake protein
VTLLWFIAIAALRHQLGREEPRGARGRQPAARRAFFTHHKWHGFVVLGSVVLCVTGGEALYADMGHFGRSPFDGVVRGVFPALLANYYGQGAMLLSSCAEPTSAVCRAATANPFYQMIPVGPMLYPWSCSRHAPP